MQRELQTVDKGARTHTGRKWNPFKNKYSYEIGQRHGVEPCL